MSQQIKVLLPYNDLSSISSSHMVEGENLLPQIVL